MSRLGIEIIVVIALFIAGAVWLDRHDAAKEEIGRQQIINADKAGVERQKQIDEIKIVAAGRIKADELQKIKEGYAINPLKLTAHVVCHSTIPSGTSAEAEVHGSESGPAVNGKESDGLYPDITTALYVLAYRLDQLNAEARQLNNETH